MRTLHAFAFALSALVSAAQQCVITQYPNTLPALPVPAWVESDLYPDGSVVVASGEGCAFGDVTVKRIDPSNSIQWSKLLATTNPFVNLSPPNRMIAMPDGGATIFGQTVIYTDQGQDSHYNNYYGIRLDSQGQVVWARYYMYYGYNVAYEVNADMIALPNNEVLLALPRRTGLNLVRLGTDGAPVWERHYELSIAQSDNRLSAMLVDGNGDILVGGRMENKLFIMRVNPNGDVLWMNHYTTLGGFSDFVSTGDGDIIALHYYAACRFAPDGSIVWYKQYSDASGLQSIDAAPGGNFLVRVSETTDFLLVDGNGSPSNAWGQSLNAVAAIGVVSDTLLVQGLTGSFPYVPIMARAWPVSNLACIATSTTTNATNASALVSLATTISVESDTIATWTMSLRSPSDSDVLELVANVGSTPARPGFETVCGAIVSNIGGSTSGAYDAVLTYDPMLTYVSATPTPTSVTSNTITWSGQPGLQGLSQDQLNVRFNVPVGTPLGTQLHYGFSVTQDSTELSLANNTYMLTETVVGSYDPNDKLVVPVGYYHLDTDTVLSYTIRFQNTGTAEAINVTIRDTLPPEVHASSFIAGASSHTYTYSLTGSGILNFYFENINLPDSNANEPMSHGFVTFRIKPNETLLPGTEVRNAADIYFDFNDPIRTPDATVVLSSSTRVPSGNIERLRAHPVPAHEAIYVLLPSEMVAHSYEIHSVDHRVMVSRKMMPTTDVLRIPLHGIPLGSYLLIVRDAEGRGSAVRFVKE